MITRFAPSPTGYLHLGNIRIALFNWLIAKKNKGYMLLRLEDTDDKRNDEKYVAEILKDLAWLKLDWQGQKKNIPWRQSQRQAFYEKCFTLLQKTDHIYPCFCHENQLITQRREQLRLGLPPRYSGHCAHLSHALAQSKLIKGAPAAWRFRLPKNIIRFEDLVRGCLSFDASLMGDFVIRRTNGSFSFLFVNAVDDADGGVTHTIRGEDHIANTPRQLALLDALSMPTPKYGHLGLITDINGKPLSKRNGLQPLHEWRLLGFLPLAIINYIGALGHRYPFDHLLSLQELINYFCLTQLSKKPSQYDEQQLKNRQKQSLMQMSDQQIKNWLGDDLLDNINNKIRFCGACRENIILPRDILPWKALLTSFTLQYDEKALHAIQKTKKSFYLVAKDESQTENWSDFCQIISQKTGKTGKSLWLPLRTALTGKTQGPAMSALFELIPRQQKMKFFNDAIQRAQSD